MTLRARSPVSQKVSNFGSFPTRRHNNRLVGDGEEVRVTSILDAEDTDAEKFTYRRNRINVSFVCGARL